MPRDTAELLHAGGSALSRGAWADARISFEAVPDIETRADALSGLGTALWWLGETGASIRCHERAYAQFRRNGEQHSAAQTAVSLCLLYRASLDNNAVSRGWLGRLARLVEDFGLRPLTGWVALCRAVSADDGDSPAAERWAREAVAAARRTGDADLELCALAELGMALSQSGMTEDGATLLDEAMAAAFAGEALRLESVVFVACRTIICCSRTCDVERAAQWVRAGDGFIRRYGGLHLYSVCRVHYAGVLFMTGRWVDAEAELRAVLRIGTDAEPWLYAEAVAGLSELRLAQGRLAEAAELLCGYEGHAAASCALAGIHLAQGEPGLAVDILRTRLAAYAALCLQSVRATEALAEAELAAGDAERAIFRAEELAAFGTSARCELIVARGNRIIGRAAAARGDADRALGHLHRALDGFSRLGMPLESARTGMALAALLRERSPDAAIGRARAALAAFEQLGAGADADSAAALLRSLGKRTARGGPSHAGVLTRREDEVLDLIGEGLSNRDLAERLVLSRKTVEHHVASVLAKLGLSRAEAVAYAVRHPDRKPTSHGAAPQARAS